MPLACTFALPVGLAFDYEKLEVGSRGEAVFEAVQQGLIRLRD